MFICIIVLVYCLMFIFLVEYFYFYLYAIIFKVDTIGAIFTQKLEQRPFYLLLTRWRRITHTNKVPRYLYSWFVRNKAICRGRSLFLFNSFGAIFAPLYKTFHQVIFLLLYIRWRNESGIVKILRYRCI